MGWNHQPQSQTGKPACDRVRPSVGHAPVRLPIGQGLSPGECAQGSEALGGRRCLSPSKGPFKAALSPPPALELPNWVQLLSSLNTLKVWLLTEKTDSLGAETKECLIVCVC